VFFGTILFDDRFVERIIQRTDTFKQNEEKGTNIDKPNKHACIVGGVNSRSGKLAICDNISGSKTAIFCP
jgi:hypothetical protein